MYKKAIENLKQCYVGLDESGFHTVDQSLMKDDLKFKFAMHHIYRAIESGKITQDSFLKEISSEHRKLQ